MKYVQNGSSAGDGVIGDGDEGSDDEGESEGGGAGSQTGEGVEEMLRVLEESGALPDIEGLMEAEDPQVTCPALPCSIPFVLQPCHRPYHDRTYGSTCRFD